MNHGQIDLEGAINNDQSVAADMIIENKDQDKDILVKVNDGGAVVTTHQVHGDVGAVNLPVQPAFLVRPSTEQSNIRTDDTFFTIVFGTEIFDVGNNFASNTFTAPVTGKYLFTINVSLGSIDAAAVYYQIWLVTSNRAYEVTYMGWPGNALANDGSWVFVASFVADMDASDTAYVQMRQYSGAQQTDILTTTYFSGALIS